MILSDKDVKQRLKEGKLKIDPLEVEEQIMPVGVDLRLGNEFKMFKRDVKSHIDPSKDKLEDTMQTIMIEDGKSLMLHPGEFILGVTKEFIRLPDNIAGRIDGRSSLGRMGIIVHSTAGHVDPGFEGKLTLEITNIGKLPVMLFPGMKFCSIIFEEISSPVEKDYQKVGKYVGDTSPAVSKISLEFNKKINKN